jgi:glycosyltransferase involved in cell wall biosynthesis
MQLVQITPGAGAMYCGNCLRDNALVAELRQRGHQALMVPLYLPLTLDEGDQSAGVPVFFGGINVYLDQKLAWFRRAPDWLRRGLASPRLLRWAGARAAKTRAAEVGALTVSMLRGETGHQVRELEEFVAWLKQHRRPEVICLSNALLVGLARRLKAELGAPIVCGLQGEDYFLDAMPSPHREQAWKTLSERAADVDRFVAPSRYFGELMARRLKLPPERVRVVPNGIQLAGYGDPISAHAVPVTSTAPVLGYFARMCREKGLDLLVEAYLRLRRRQATRHLKLRVGGSCGPADQPFVEGLRQRLAAAGVLEDTEFRPNLDRAQKIAFLQSLSVFSVPALYGEAFGLYVIEALAAGVPVVQPRAAAFPELVEGTGGGLLCAPGDPEALAEAVASLVTDSDRARACGAAGRAAVHREFSVTRMAQRMIAVFEEVGHAQPATSDASRV